MLIKIYNGVRLHAFLSHKYSVQLIPILSKLPHPYTHEMAQECIKTHKTRFQEKKGVPYAITLKDTGEIIGTISLMDI